MSAASRFATWMGVDDGWQRPTPTSWLPDILLTVGLLGFGAFDVILVSSMARLDSPVWALALAMAGGIIPLLWRRRFPLVVGFWCGIYLFAAGSLVVEVPSLMSVQVACFLALFSAVAWARDRRALVIVMALVLLFMSGWLAWYYALSSGIDRLQRYASLRADPGGLLSPVIASVTYSALVNSIYFVGAFLAGQVAWRQARNHATVVAQAATIASQQSALTDQAVVDERLRIARELHDVVAHHVSVIGVQAGAARRVIDKDPAAAATALGTIEGASRQAVTEMRQLLGTLRSPDTDPREPGPTLDQLPQLIDSYRDGGFDVTYQRTDAGAIPAVPAGIQLSVYRIVQEALANVRQHSTTRSASVVVRTAADPHSRGYVEAEVLDAGRPRPNTAGTGLGQRGISERVASHDGQCEMGPRATGGYRVRVRFPLPQEPA